MTQTPGKHEPFLRDVDVTIHLGDCLEVLSGMDTNSANAVVTSPPYMDLRPDYEPFGDYISLWHGFARVVSGPVVINVGRSFRNSIESLWWLHIIETARECGWGLLDTLVWIKPNANPIHGNVFANSHEYVFVFGLPGCVLNTDGIRTPYSDEGKARMRRAWVNGQGVKGEVRSSPQPDRDLNPLGARARSTITHSVGAEKGNPHPAPMPAALAEHLVTLASFPGQCVLDPFFGSGTTGLAARKLGRQCVGIEKREDYCEMAAARLGQQSLLAEGTA